MKISRLKEAPKFQNEVEEQAFWETHSITDYVDFRRAKKGSALDFHEKATRTISIRLPQAMIQEMKAIASKIDVGYQALMKMWIAEKMSEARRNL